MASKASNGQDWFITPSDKSSQNDVSETASEVARKLVNDIYLLPLIDGLKLVGSHHEEVVRLFVRSFNTNLRELGQLLDRNGDQLAKQYQPTGVEIGKWFGRTYADLALVIGQSARTVMLMLTDPIKGSLSIGNDSEFVAVDPDLTVEEWGSIRKMLERAFDKADLQRLRVALDNEQKCSAEKSKRSLQGRRKSTKANRNAKFAKASEEGSSAKEIAANWNASVAPDEHVSETTVRQAIKRHRDKT